MAPGPVSATAEEPPGDLFDQYEVVTGKARERQIPLAGFFLGGDTAEVAVVRVDETHERRLRMLGFEGGAWVPVLEATLSPEVLFVDAANVGGRDRLLTYGEGRLAWFDPEAATERALVSIPTDYRPSRGIRHVDVTRDLNGDGRDDLVVPDVDGFWISTQLADGTFTDPVKLGPPEPFRQEFVRGLDLDEPGLDESSTYGDVGITAVTVPWYLSRVHAMDHDLDGRIDLVFWNEDRFDVHHQDESGRFDPVAEPFSVEVPFDSDGAYSRMFDYSGQGVLSAIFGVGERTRRTVLHSFRDLNGDGVADLVTLTLAGRSLTRQRSVYEVYFGSSTPGGIAFARDAGSAIHPRGRGGGMQPWGYSSDEFGDFDGDGRADLLFRSVKVGLGGMMRALVGNSVPINLELYRGDDGLDRDGPAARRRIRRFAPFAGLGNIFFPAVLVGDVNGDGRSDLLAAKSPRELHVFLGVPGPDLLARRPLEVAVGLPYDERNIWVVDLDGDAKQDLLVHRAPTERAPTEPHRLTLLIAR